MSRTLSPLISKGKPLKITKTRQIDIDMWEISDPLNFILLLAFPLFLFAIAFYLKHLDVENWVIRKYVHTIGLLTAGVYGAFLPSLLDTLILVGVLLFIVLVLSLPPIRLLEKLAKMAHRDNEEPIMVLVNGFMTSIGVVLLVVIFFDIKWIFMASIYCVALGDGMGEFIGKPFGKHKYKIFLNKSIEGSLAVFLGSIVGGIIPLAIFSLLSVDYILVIIFASLLVTLVEAASIIFIDNILMPLTYAATLWFFLIQ